VVEHKVSPKSHKSESFFHLHLISDATGETLLAVGRAAAAQYATVSSIEHVFPLIRNQKQLSHALSEVEANPGVVLYTLVDKDLATRLETRCRKLGLPCLHFEAGARPLPKVSRGPNNAASWRNTPDAGYFPIDVLNFTMLHDDGQHATRL
jgi:regulator of PEP synthase PpsR (kinase-PPPase family)